MAVMILFKYDRFLGLITYFGRFIPIDVIRQYLYILLFLECIKWQTLCLMQNDK